MSSSESDQTERTISLLGAVSIGIGGMVGGGIFAVLGLAAVTAKGATPVSFVVAGLVALLTAYSYAKMSVLYPSQGGTVVIVDRAFGAGWFTGTINNLLWLSYIVTLALYAVAFGNYSTTFLSPSLQTPFALHALISLGIILPTILNLCSAEFVSKAEAYIVVFKLILLAVIIIFGFGSVNFNRLSPTSWDTSFLQLVGAGMLIFVAYEGFELIANTADEIQDYRKNLPLAYLISVALVIVLYVLIAVVVVGSLPAELIAKTKDFALAEAAKPSLGSLGFSLVGVAAVLATLSAINSTLYGAARLSFTIATEGELPAVLEQKIWGQPVGLLITASAALGLANLVPLESISLMASAGFLLIFSFVNLANRKMYKEANSNPIIAAMGFLACMGALLALLGQTFASGQIFQIWFFLGMIGTASLLEVGYQYFLSEPRSSRV